MDNNLYDILNINKNATEDEIKKIYKKLALKYHPDRNNNSKESEEKFNEISNAYNILSNPSKRKQYDLTGNIGDNIFSESDAFNIFSNIFEGSFANFTDNIKSSSTTSSFMFSSGFAADSDDFLSSFLNTENIIGKIGKISKNLNDMKNIKKENFEKEDKDKNAFENEDNKDRNLYYTLNISLEQVYLRKVKKLSIDRIRFKNSKYITEKHIINIPLYYIDQEITFKGEGDEYNGHFYDIFITLNCKPDIFKYNQNHDLIIDKNISISDLYSDINFNITHIDNTIINVNIDKNQIIKDNMLVCIAKNKGIPKSSNNNLEYNDTGDLYIKFNIVPVEINNNEQINTLQNIFPSII
jgi:DnaJ family protein B protein 4